MKDEVKVDHNEGTVHVPGSGSLPLIGVDPKKLSDKQKQHERTTIQIRRMKMSIWKCTQCKRSWSGKFVRYKPEMVGGIMTDAFTCPDRSCGAPVVIFKDAFDLVNGPKESRADLKRTSLPPRSEMNPCTLQTFEKFLEAEYRRGGIGTQVEIGRQVQCATCTECVMLQKNWTWEVIR